MPLHNLKPYGYLNGPNVQILGTHMKTLVDVFLLSFMRRVNDELTKDRVNYSSYSIHYLRKQNF